MDMTPHVPAARWDAGISRVPKHSLTVWRYIKTTYEGFSNDDAMTLGAALAYYTVFSLAPLLLTVTSIAGLVLGRETVRNDIQNQIQMLIGPGSAEEIKIMLSHATQNQSGGVLGTVIGIVVLLLGATGTFGSL